MRTQFQTQQRDAERAARKAAMALATALARNPRSALLAVLVETAAAMLEIAELRAETIPADEAKIVLNDLEGDAVSHFADLLHSGVSFEEARTGAVQAIDDTEAAFHTLIAKRAADAWLQAEREIGGLLKEAGLA